MTWSKTLDEGGDGYFGVEGGVPEDPYNPKGSRGPASFDIPQMLTANTIYELPFGTGKRFSTGNRFGDYVIGNWQVNGIFSARSGQHLNIIAAGDICEYRERWHVRESRSGGQSLPERSHCGQSVLRSAIGSDAYPHSVVQPLRVRDAQKWDIGECSTLLHRCAELLGSGHVRPPALPDQRELFSEGRCRGVQPTQPSGVGQSCFSFGQISTLSLGNAQRILQLR